MPNHIIAICLAVCLGLHSLGSQLRGESDVPNFQKQVLPLLESHCGHCHGADTQEANIRFDQLSTNLVRDRAAAETWHEVRNVLNKGEMPPEEEEPLTQQDRALILSWIDHAIEVAIEAQRNSDGRVVLRRLNRVEYQNTMRDLLGMEMNYVRDLPPDAVTEDGFRNDGQALQMSPIQLEFYLQTARRALDRLIVTGEAPQVFHHEFTETQKGGWLGNAEQSNTLGRQQEFLAKMKRDYPEQGEFQVTVTVEPSLKPNTGFPLLEVSVGYRPDTKILLDEFELVEVDQPGEQTFQFRGRLEDFPLPVRGQGKYPGLVVRVRNVYDDDSPKPKRGKDKKYPVEGHLPTLAVKSVVFDGPLFDDWPPQPHREILPPLLIRDTDEKAYATEVLQRFMPRAYRRPVTPAEVKLLTDFFAQIRPEFPTLEDALRETLAMVLIRPEFLYLVEPAGNKPRPINDWELATRLSYFLWSSMPDEALRTLAAEGKLRAPKTLRAQIERMLNAPQAKHFFDQFVDQWLHMHVVDSVAIDTKRYPEFQSALKDDMREETRAFIAELIQHNLSALNVLDANFTMLNEPLAKHYGVEQVYGTKFRRVSLPADSKRGGVLGHASVLLSNSTGSDSHAVRRAVWIRDRLLNDPPPPPPPDVPDLSEADPKFHKLSIREQLEIHREREACASCHRNIDPWGIALENYDALGLWRDELGGAPRRKTPGQPVVARDTLPNGQELNGAQALKQYLLTAKKQEFARSLVARLLTYGLGRRLELSDQEVVDELTAQFAADKYRLRNLIHKVVTSSPFQTK